MKKIAALTFSVSICAAFPAMAEVTVMKLPGNVTVLDYQYNADYTNPEALANIETAAGGQTPSAAPQRSPVTIINDPLPMYDAITGQSIQYGPALNQTPEPLSLRDRVRGKLAD